MVYGNFKSNEVTEKTSCEPLGIYAALKFSAEKNYYRLQSSV